MSFIAVDLPPPEPPRMILVSPLRTLKLMRSRTTRSSNESDTSRNSMAGVMRSRSSTSWKVDSAAASLTPP